MSPALRFKVEIARGGRLFVDSAGTARQAFTIALEELGTNAADAVGIATTHVGLSELLEGFAAVGDAVPHVLAVLPTSPVESAWDGLDWKFAFAPEHLPLLAELARLAPRSAAEPLELPFLERKGGAC